MRNVLFITYYFPPAGGPGVQRVAKHVRYLRDFGYNPIVLTVDPTDYSGHSELRMPLDDSMLGDVPKETEIHRIPSHQPFRMFERLNRLGLEFLRELLFVPDSAHTWILPAVREAKKIAASRPVDLIYTSVRPHSSAIIGWLLQRKLRRPWILDFRDPWTQYFLARFPTWFHYRLEQWLERFLLRRADRIVTITPSARRNLLSWCRFLPAERVTFVTNGFDSPDFGEHRPEDRPDRRWTLLYAGAFCGGAAPEGSRGRWPIGALRTLRKRLAFVPRSFDRATHSPRYLLEALRLLLSERPELRPRVRLAHVGPSAEADRRYVRDLGLEGVVEWEGYRPHSEAARLVLEADALFLCLADSPSGEPNDCVPQKTFEYLGSGRPILALVPDGDARDILTRSGGAVLCRPRDVAAIKDGLVGLIEGAAVPVRDESYIRGFERRNLSARLAAVFDLALEQRSPAGPCLALAPGAGPCLVAPRVPGEQGPSSTRR